MLHVGATGKRERESWLTISSFRKIMFHEINELLNYCNNSTLSAENISIVLEEFNVMGYNDL
jgi:hypothetical protein